MRQFSSLYDQALSTLRSNTIAQMSDEDIENYMFNLAIRAIGSFKFPRVSLDFDKDIEGNYAFKEEISQKEVNVLLAYMKMYWLQQQIDSEERFENLYYDKDVKTFSRGNMMKALKARYEVAIDEAERAEYNYSRMRDENGNDGMSRIYLDE